MPTSSFLAHSWQRPAYFNEIRRRSSGSSSSLPLWPGRIGAGTCEGIGLRIPDLQVFENLFDHIDTVDERDDAAAVDTRKRIDLVHLLNQPCPGGLATSIGSRLASDAAEQLTFQTIYPCRYALRTPHIQLKILEGDSCNTTTQLHLPEEQNQGLYRTLDYARAATQDTLATPIRLSAILRATSIPCGPT